MPEDPRQYFRVQHSPFATGKNRSSSAPVCADETLSRKHLDRFANGVSAYLELVAQFLLGWKCILRLIYIAHDSLTDNRHEVLHAAACDAIVFCLICFGCGLTSGASHRFFHYGIICGLNSDEKANPRAAPS